MDGFERITGREHEGLVEKCQENGWLKVGGFDWQDDPFLEEYPYEFSRTESVDRLREALGSGNWAIRQGFCYRDLAFIQQVNGGDEWWTLKRDGDAWTGFESWSFGAIAQEPERFERAMLDMCEATPEQCRSGEWAHLREKAPEPLAQRAASAREASRAHAGQEARAHGARKVRRGRIGTTGARMRPFSSRLEGRRGMASDYGDEAGGKLLDWMLRIGQEAGAEAMARSARELSERIASIRGTISGGRAEAIAADGVPTYAKLSLEELSRLPEYATIKEVVSDRLRAASVEHHIIPGEGRDWLLFKVEDAPEVDEAFRQLEQETGKAADRARERLSEIAERRQEPERLAERAERAREASRAHSQGLGRDRGPRQIEGPER